MTKTVLVAGGAGYIGSHVVRALRREGFAVRVLDHLGAGHRAAVDPEILTVGDIADQALVSELVRRYRIVAALHFAADIVVPESVRDPRKYFLDNAFKSFQFINALVDAGVTGMVFSSTAAVYGNPVRFPIDEDDPTIPTNPYGESKLMIERILKAYDSAYRFRHVVLRYFNASGADPAGDIGEDHDPETHLIPIVLQVALGQREDVKVFGEDYATVDGTCVRDYVHVCDLADAHVLALRRLLDGGDSAVFNLGNGKGYSVREVIDAARRVTGRSIPAVSAPRRAGDPDRLVASSARIIDGLGWRPRFADLGTIIETAWRWHRRHPNGYPDSP